LFEILRPSMLLVVFCAASEAGRQRRAKPATRPADIREFNGREKDFIRFRLSLA
jgi:hypothetical protein